jgi:phenylalanyl-tRNA synthetase beta chain
MKASYGWLSALLPSIKASPKELAERFTRAGLEVEAVEEYGAGTGPIVIAEVRKVLPHPKREKLRLVTVACGGAEQRVVCGAPNVPEPGGLVALAPLGTTLPAVGLTLTTREIGGVVSEGMLCSERELGLSGAGAKEGEDAGILVLPPGFAQPGTKLREALPAVHDWIFHIGVPANRSDVLGHVGLSREAAALFNETFTRPAPGAPARVAKDAAIDKHVSISIEDTERCPHYGAAMVVDVEVGPSPLWLRYRLESLGTRSISNVVDITNLILLEFGHPMHAFDLDLVRGGKIIVRRAAEGEKLTTLDGVARTLTADDLVITDGGGPVALAGVMGGQNSEIRPETRRVLLECAYFSPRGIRRTSRRHGIRTESSHRFERGVDPADIPDVLAQATSLITQMASARAVPGTIVAGVPVAAPKVVPLRGRRMRELLGVSVPFGEAAQILGHLGFAVRHHHGGVGDEATAEVLVPMHRPDIGGEADLIEEVIRVRGLDAVPTELPAIRPGSPRQTLVLENRVRRAAVDVGLSEAITYGMVSPKEIAALGLPPAKLTLLNPLSEERSVMRTTLLPGLLEALRRARRHGVSDVHLFTVGSRFLAPDPNVAVGAAIEQSMGLPSAPLPTEAPSFAAVLGGHRRAVLAKPAEIDVYDAKGIALAIVERVVGRPATVAAQPAERRAPYLHPRGAADVLLDGKVVGSFGPLHPDTVDALDLDGSCVVVELDLAAIEQAGITTPHYRPIPVLPAATRDLAVVVSDDVTAGAVDEAIRKAASELCESVELFDLFRGGQVAEGHRSLAFHVVYRDPKAATDPESARTLTDEEVDQRHQRVVAAVKQQFGAVLRG